METIYKTIVNDRYIYKGSDQEAAIRAWDSESAYRADIAGGVMVQSFHGAVMVRDGWILHVNKEGHVYLNPRI